MGCICFHVWAIVSCLLVQDGLDWACWDNWTSRQAWEYMTESENRESPIIVTLAKL